MTAAEVAQTTNDRRRQQFITACFEAMRFTDTGDEDQPAKCAPINDETALDLTADCRSFWRRFGCYCEPAEMSPARAGHDFWLTRNGHGSGFWDGDWPVGYADMLTKGATCYGEFETYRGDNGEICS